MGLIVAWDAVCDCEGCPKCEGEVGGYCGDSADVILAPTQTVVIEELRGWGWAVSRKDGQVYLLCPRCRRRKR